MSGRQFLQVAAVILLILAAIISWAWRPNWPSSAGWVAGWAGLACWAAAGLVT
jgi:hypothetical protein